MLSKDSEREFQEQWLPHLTDSGLRRLMTLIEQESPFLIQGDWLHDGALGCLATHAGWHHPQTGHHEYNSGVAWLRDVAGVDPLRSKVIRDWDAGAGGDGNVRRQIHSMLEKEMGLRRCGKRRTVCSSG